MNVIVLVMVLVLFRLLIVAVTTQTAGKSVRSKWTGSDEKVMGNKS